MDNPGVMPSQGRAFLVLALAASLALLSAITPPAHVHEADADHAHAVVHRHFESHDRFAPHDHEAAEISHDEGPVIWLDDVGIEPATHQFAAALAILTVETDSLPEPRGWTGVSRMETAPPHGPPRQRSSPRAPPFPSC